MIKINLSLLLFVALLFCRCNTQQTFERLPRKFRQPVDTVGFAHLGWQMDSVMDRIIRSEDGEGKTEKREKVDYEAKVVVCPHDDYSYVGGLYPSVLCSIHARTIILFGVAHKAKLLGLENVLVFDSYDSWQEPYGPVKVSDIREEIMKELPASCYQVNDSMQAIEHSVEALIPFLQYFNKNVEIVSILVPYMSFDRIDTLAGSLARAIDIVTDRHQWRWGSDFTIAISSDAVHYGDEDWGGSNYAFYGVDSAGYEQAVAHEWEIINTISGELKPDHVKKFMGYLVQEDNFRVYKWTWCGRYSVPMGLMTSCYLAQLEGNELLTGMPVGYSTSIDHEHIRVDELRMGVTAPANIRHWVGYAGIVYK